MIVPWSMVIVNINLQVFIQLLTIIDVWHLGDGYRRSLGLLAHPLAAFAVLPLLGTLIAKARDQNWTSGVSCWLFSTAEHTIWTNNYIAYTYILVRMVLWYGIRIWLVNRHLRICLLTVVTLCPQCLWRHQTSSRRSEAPRLEMRYQPFFNWYSTLFRENWLLWYAMIT